MVGSAFGQSQPALAVQTGGGESAPEQIGAKTNAKMAR
jgi:hypothetical protein